jgi:flavin reductase (DIM6/NTAB) family NADH-FMN oxidoreductase RutF
MSVDTTTTEAPAERRPLDSKEFRDIIGRFASGVTVITAEHEGRPYGTTASAVSSLSLDPPMLLVCLNKSSSTGQAIAAARRFAVNILAEGQADAAMQFAGKGDKFAGQRIVAGGAGQPLLEDALANLECRVVEEVTGGTHSVFLPRSRTRRVAPARRSPTSAGSSAASSSGRTRTRIATSARAS